MPMKVILAQPRGFCAGVVRAIEIVERALEKYGPPVYVRHEIVHNKYVVESLKNKGAIFVEELSEVPPKAVTVFSDHGVARSVERALAARDLLNPNHGEGAYRFQCTADVESFKALGTRFLQMPLGEVKHVELANTVRA